MQAAGSFTLGKFALPAGWRPENGELLSVGSARLPARRKWPEHPASRMSWHGTGPTKRIAFNKIGYLTSNLQLAVSGQRPLLNMIKFGGSARSHVVA